MRLPKITIKYDKKLDEEMFLEFLETTPEWVNNVYKKVKTKQDVLNIMNQEYDKNNAQSHLNNFKLDIEKVNEVMLEISKIFNYEWSGIGEITIIPAVCPVSPRFLEKNTFFVPCFPKSIILPICAHELTHFLYFKKIIDKIGERINTEYPSVDWLISEIIAQHVVNNEKIQKIVNFKQESVSVPNDIQIDEKKCNKINKLFDSMTDILEFRKLAIKEIGRNYKK